MTGAILLQKPGKPSQNNSIETTHYPKQEYTPLSHRMTIILVHLRVALALAE